MVKDSYVSSSRSQQVREEARGLIPEAPRGPSCIGRWILYHLHHLESPRGPVTDKSRQRPQA